jgi:hypothetical protein
VTTFPYPRLFRSKLGDGIGHRLSGSKSLERAVTWAREAMRADGLDSVWLQPVRVPKWVRGRESATLVEPGPQTIAMLGLGRSVGTAPGGVRAPAVPAASFPEVDAPRTVKRLYYGRTRTARVRPQDTEDSTSWRRRPEHP